ncbi:MAG: hypothetical protein K2Q17_18185 [Nitrospiraceae bacterium]|nr:hypothetical protein [Nitrospiraceae bacterium]
MRRTCRDDRWWLLIVMLAILSPAALSGCVETPSSRHVTAKDTLLGKSESEVVACTGAPRTASSQDRVKVLTYQKSSGPLEGSFPGAKGSRPEGARHGCTATLTLQDDRVFQVQYRTTPDSSDLHEHCEEIFRHCVPQ